MLYSGQITYGSVPISRKLIDNLTQQNLNLRTQDTLSDLAQFTSIRIAKSHFHMVQTLRMLQSNIDTEGNNEPITLNQAMKQIDWQKSKKAMQAKYDFLIENET